ncbi:Oidioi.mRNA.OKI2018_I69.XSR.g14884.t1.cds [Oikopleura dioica]|uniref:Oidioi.mRNA.OKI2018_I69.XSR.g14884.t1.cds n=1 Tax=Oikopleura dioica TaxID=34765 RepID=A0ABN7SK47_OIKDI|nr:Oidioi.mRNA.OKI2018_I69.XSR.g14884.t1.cds [Oikopleura dioica]
MKLLPAILASTLGFDADSPMEAIQFAHSRVRNGFVLPEMEEINFANERLLAETFSPSNRNLNVQDAVERSNNITLGFFRQGSCDTSFPSLDGSCNAPNDLGRSMQQYTRLVPADYCDGQQSPRCSSRGRPLPSERQVMIRMRGTNGAPTRNPVASYAFTAWGQFLTHDIIQTPDVGGASCACNGSNNNCKVIDIDRQTDPILTFPCMFIKRSSGKVGQQGGEAVREQVNQLSAFIDGTVVYGFTNKHKNLLLAADGMHLKMRNSPNGPILPGLNQFNDNQIKKDFAAANVFNDKGHTPQVAGDTRVMENPILMSFHTMFARLHNRVTFVGAILKQITYNEYLPILLGRNAINLFPGVRMSKADKRPARTRFAKEPDEEEIMQRNTGFVPPAQDNPSIRQEFLVAGFRVGHSTVPEQLLSANRNLQVQDRRDLKDNYFDPDMSIEHGPAGCIRGAMAGDSNRVSGSYAQATMSHLFKPNNFRHGTDLGSINIARGREHGVGSYEAVKRFCMGHESFRRLYNGNNPAMINGWNNILRLYDDPEDVDLYVGILNEQKMPGAEIGPTAGCIVLEQFIALKRGDRFWHENAGVFTDAQLAEIKSTTLAKVICETMEDMERTNKNVFLRANIRFQGQTNNIVTCANVGKLDFRSWRVEETQGPNDQPDPETATSAPQTQTADRVEFGCKLVNGRRHGLIECGRAGDWTDATLDDLVEHVKRRGGIPIQGKRQQMVNLALKAVRRISIAGNSQVTSSDKLKGVISQFNNLLELDISGTGISSFTTETISNNNVLGNVNLEGTNVNNIDMDLFMKLRENLARGNKFIFFG